MDLELSDDQLELARVAREVLDRHAPLELARSFFESDPDPTPLWRTLAELGWFGVGLPEDVDFGVPGICLLAFEVGAHAAPVPLAETSVVAQVLAGEDAAAGDDVAEALLSGEEIASLAVLEQRTDWSLHGFATEAVPSGTVYHVSGTKLLVPYANAVSAFGVLAQANGERVLALVKAGKPGVSVTPQGAVDPTRASGRLELRGTAVAETAVHPLDASRGKGRAFALGTIATAAEAVGAASKALEMATAYALEREQFGRPIGSFQALQHLLADLHVLRETSWSTVLYAAAALQGDVADAEESVAIAKAHTSRATRRIAEGALQVFGGVGFTREHDLHLLYRRILDCERRFGDSLHHERRLVELAPAFASWQADG